MNRDEIHIISRHSNWSKEGIQKALSGHIYPNENNWLKFLKPAFQILSLGFILIGLIFFFAYNWAELETYFKFGIPIFLSFLFVFLSLSSNTPKVIKDLCLLGASILIGILFAIFGQTYQTGANSFDLFLVWTICILLWIIFSGFWLQWLLLLFLVNTTLILYSNQIAYNWDEVYLSRMLFTLNSVFLLGMLRFNQINKSVFFPHWTVGFISLVLIFIGTISISITIFEDNILQNFSMVLLVSIMYIIGILLGLASKRLFYPAIVLLSVIILLASLIIRWNSNIEGLLLVSAFMVLSISLLLSQLIKIHKSWKHA